jgi:hypothetical protein
MDLQQLKLYAINGSTLGVTTFTNIEMGLKIFLLIVTIGEKLVQLAKLQQKRSLKYGLALTPLVGVYAVLRLVVQVKWVRRKRSNG